MKARRGMLGHAHADSFLKHGAGLLAELETRRQPTPEQRLLAAVLARAIYDARAGHADAIAWLESDAVTAPRSFTFVAVCSQLEIDPAWARAEIAKRVKPRRRRVLKAAQSREAA